jgi:hypothetical protein
VLRSMLWRPWSHPNIPRHTIPTFLRVGALWNHNHERTRIPTKTSSSCLHVSPLPWTKQDISITGAYSFQRSCLPHSCDATCWQSPFLIHPHSSVCLVGLHQPPLHSRPIAQTIMADHNRQTAVDDAYLLT